MARWEAFVTMATPPSLRLPLLFLLLLIGPAVAEEQQLVYHLREQQDEGTFVGNLARDSELYRNFTNAQFQQLQYSLSSQGSPHAAKFSVDQSTSTLRTAAVLDREQECQTRRTDCGLNFDVGVYMKPAGSSNLDLIKIIHVVINLDDINDNAPEFPNTAVTLSVPESVPADHVLLTSGAVDRDSGNNSIQSYVMEPPSSMFGLRVISNMDGSSDLGIVVLHSLDRETRDTFQVRVVARDGGYPQRSGSVVITISVTDVNDNRPLFVNTTFAVTVREDVPVNSTILTLAANDPDSGDNGRLAFSISMRASRKVQETLGMRRDTGELYLKKVLDFEGQDQVLQFLVEVQDHGTPPLSSQAEVVLTIADVNDNAPQININLPPGGSAVSEELELGAFIAHVSVADKDGGDNGKLVCSILDPHFTLQRFSDVSYIYKILLRQTLDYEQAASHRINVSCSDHGDPPRHNSTSFTLRVKDVNDNAPTFTLSTYRVTVPENNAVGHSVLEVKANDPDKAGSLNSQVVYFLLKDARSRFTIDPTTGVILATVSFDREEMAEYHFHVAARDLGSPSRSSSSLVIVQVGDQNDEPSTFRMRHFHMNVVEEQNSGVVVGTLNVTDNDTTVGDLRFTISGPNGIHQYFSVESDTGVIRTAAMLDRETKDSFDFAVDLVDREHPEFRDTANVTVSVLDINDKDPVIIFSNNSDSVSLPFHETVGFVICRIMSYDDDVGRNAQVTLNIEEGNTRNLFFINAAGKLVVAKQMRRSDIDTYRLVVAARDGGQPQRKAYSHLTVVVTNSNVTGIADLHDLDQSQNVAIVVTLVVVTLVLSVAVVVTICIIRRIDRERRQQHVHSKANEHVICTSDTQGADKVPTIVTARSEPYGTEIDRLKKKIKDELSFIVDEENETFEDTSTLTQGNSFTTFKNMTSYSSLDRKVMAPRASSSVLQRPDPQSSDTHLKSTGSPHLEGQGDPRLLSNRNLNILGGQPRPDSPTKAAHAKKGILKHLDGEVASQLSETGDSGRGGSDEDVRSHRGSTHLQSDTEDPKHYLGGVTLLTFHAERVCQLGGPEMRHHPDNPRLFSQPHHGGASCSLNLPRNISVSDDSSTANTTVDLRSRGATPTSLGSPSFLSTTPRTPRNPPRLPARGTTPYTDARRYCGSDASYRGTFLAGTSGLKGLPGNESGRTGGYSFADLDDALTEETMTTRDDDEDRTTTTSGSYTINADELCNEIDHLFFKDVIV